VVFDLVVSPEKITVESYLPAFKLSRNIHPFVSVLFVGFDQKTFFLFAPGVFPNVWI